MAEKKLGKSRELASRTMFAALEALKAAGGALPRRDLLSEVERRIELDDWAKERYEKTGYIRWQAILHFFSVDLVKAGYIVKREGSWFLTEEGEKAIGLGPRGVLESAQRAYRQWKAGQPVSPSSVDEPEEVEEENAASLPTLDQVEQLAGESIEAAIRRKNPYEFQDLVAALLRGMGYHTPVIAPRGKDGGVDVVAYRDPLGTVAPRILVQVKHRPDSTIGVQEIRQLAGVLRKDGDVGLFVSTGGFSADARGYARDAHNHVELIDLPRFIRLWQDFYKQLSDDDKTLLPLRAVYFVAPEA